MISEKKLNEKIASHEELIDHLKRRRTKSQSPAVVQSLTETIKERKVELDTMIWFGTTVKQISLLKLHRDSF